VLPGFQRFLYPSSVARFSFAELGPFGIRLSRRHPFFSSADPTLEFGEFGRIGDRYQFAYLENRTTERLR
jgi:hypothetical protein